MEIAGEKQLVGRGAAERQCDTQEDRFNCAYMLELPTMKTKSKLLKIAVVGAGSKRLRRRFGATIRVDLYGDNPTNNMNRITDTD